MFDPARRGVETIGYRRWKREGDCSDRRHLANQHHGLTLCPPAGLSSFLILL